MAQRRKLVTSYLSKALIKLAPEDLEFTEIPIEDLPLYSYDNNADFPTEGRVLKDAIECSDGILSSYPGTTGPFRRAEERHRLGSRPWGTNSSARKPIGIIGASPGRSVRP